MPTVNVYLIVCLLQLDEHIFCQFRILIVFLIKDILQFAYHDLIATNRRIEIYQALL